MDMINPIFMKTIKQLFILLLTFLVITNCTKQEKSKRATYKVNRLTDSLVVDANWNKPQWQKVNSLAITNIMGEKPKHAPSTEVKMLYDDNFIYVIFHVKEKYVKATATNINDYVYRDSGVEFFFTPSETIEDGYFNLETNCIGTPYFKHQIIFQKDVLDVDVEDIKKIKIEHSLDTVIDTEIEELTEWTLEYKIPISMLKKYTKVTTPSPGVIWRANFYKTADATSNPHYITWNVVESDTPNFHLPKYFGIIKFN